MASSLSREERAWSVSSMRKTNLPPCLRAKHEVEERDVGGADVGVTSGAWRDADADRSVAWDGDAWAHEGFLYRVGDELIEAKVLTRCALMFCVNDGDKVTDRLLEAIVDDDVLVAMGLFDLSLARPRGGSSSARALRPSPHEASFKGLKGWGHHEDGHGLGVDLHQLDPTLRIDIEEDVKPCIKASLDLGFAGAVALRMDMGPFGESILLDHRVKGRVVDEVVALAFHLSPGVFLASYG